MMIVIINCLFLQLFFHGEKMKKLHEHVDPSCLPEDYGGTLPKINYGGKEWFGPLMTAEESIKSKLF
jgi:hypothetical protein